MTKAKRKLSKVMAGIVILAMIMSLFSAVTFADESAGTSVTYNGTEYEQYEASYTGTGSYAQMGAMISSMVGRYFGSYAYVAENSDGTYSVALAFEGTSGYSSAISTVAICEEEGDTSGTDSAAVTDWTGTDDQHAFIFTTSSLTDIHVYLYVGGNMSMGITFDLDLAAIASDEGTDEEDDNGSDDSEDTDDESGDSDSGSGDADNNSGDTENNSGDSDSNTDDNSSDDADTDSNTDSDDTSADTDSYGLEIGRTYSVDVTYTGTGTFAQMQSTLDSMIGQYFGYSVYVTPLSDGTYNVVIYFGGTTGYSSAISDITYSEETVSQSDDQTYTLNISSLSDPVDISLYVGGGMNMTVTYQMNLDASSAVPADDDSDDDTDDDTSDETPDTLEIVDGDGQSIIKGDDLVITVSGADITSVKVDGSAVSSSYYTISDGIVTLSGDYTDKLALGSHTITFVYDGGEEAADFTVTDSYGLEPGTYYPSSSLSAYISAMGGVQFGSGLIDYTKVVVNEDGTYTITVYFKTSTVTIYNTTVSVFVDASDSTPGYYYDGKLNYASYTLSSKTVTDADGNAVHYVRSMTFTVDDLSSSYYLWLYVNSSVMGIQFGNGKGSGSSNQPGVSTPYSAILTINWSSIGVSEDDIPKTGQEDNLFLWGALLAVSAAGLTVLIRRRIKFSK